MYIAQANASSANTAHHNTDGLTTVGLSDIHNALIDCKWAYYAFYGSSRPSTATTASATAANSPDSSTGEVKTCSIFTFLYKLSDGYITMARAREPDVLCLLAFFAVMLYHLERGWLF